MQPQRYDEPCDLHRAQAALMGWARERGHCNYLHKGDIGHRLFNTCYGYDKGEVFRYWLDASGKLAAFAILCPHWEFFNLQVAPRLLFGAEHGAFLAFCERETRCLAKRLNISLNALAVEACDCEPAYSEFLEARGYQRDKHALTITRHDLSDLPEAKLPPGFRFHAATASDIERLADVHNHSFADKWSAESYGAAFGAPHMEYEWVVVAPDGRFAAFTQLWIDDVNRSLLFEPVGTHSDFRRQGIGKALMVHALRRMRAERGIERAYVGHEPPAKNPASGALYASVGFQPLYDIYDYKKPVRQAAGSF